MERKSHSAAWGSRPLPQGQLLPGQQIGLLQPGNPGSWGQSGCCCSQVCKGSSCCTWVPENLPGTSMSKLGLSQPLVPSGKALPSLRKEGHCLTLVVRSQCFPMWGNRLREGGELPEAAQQATGTAPWSSVSVEPGTQPKGLDLPHPHWHRDVLCVLSCVRRPGGGGHQGCKSMG